MTLSRLFHRFLDAKRAAQKSALTISGYESDFEGFRGWLRDHRYPDSLSSLRFSLLEAYAVHLSQHYPKANTILRKLNVLSSFATWLVTHELLRSNPLAKLQKPKTPRTLIRVLSDEEMARLLAIDVTPKWAAIRAMLCYAGLRRSELLNLDLRDVHLDRGLIQVRGKGAKDRLVPIAASLEVTLLAYLPERDGYAPEDPVFPGEITYRLRIATLAKTLSRWGRAIGRPDLTPHLLRHTFATQFLRRGGKIRVLQPILGHESIESTQGYTHLAEEELMAPMRQFGYASQRQDGN